MDSPHAHSHDTHGPGAFWRYLSIALALGFALVVLLLGGGFIIGAISGPKEKPAEASSAASTTAAAEPAAANGSVIAVTIKTGPVNPMSYDTPSFTVKSGEKVKLTFDNDNAAMLPHNFNICKPGTKDAVIALANAMLTDPSALAKGYLPETSDILWHTKLIQAKSSETLEFTAPAPGDYPYVCTFPGHSIIMNGVMKVE